LLVAHIPEEDDANELALVEFNRLTHNWNRDSHEQADDQLDNLGLLGLAVIEALAGKSNAQTNGEARDNLNCDI